MLKNVLLFSFMMILLLGIAQENYSKYVDPFIGTGGHGHTYPGPCMPFGMVQVGPDTRNDGSWDSCGGYHYSDSTILGFSHTHLSGVGVPDYGDILLMPVQGEVSLNPYALDGKRGYASTYSHDREDASPGYYSVYLEDNNVNVELTCTDRVGFHRYMFEKEGNVSVLLDLIHRDPVMEASIHVVGKNRIEGSRRSKYWAGDQQQFFVIEFSKDFDKVQLYEDGKSSKGQVDVKGKQLQSIAHFHVSKDEPLEVKVALSAVSVEGARKNLETETADLDFKGALTKAQKSWEKQLSKIEVEGGSEKQKRIFYTSLYHCLLTPNLYEDVDGQYRGIDGKVYRSDDFTNYTVFSLWDTFRALHPLLAIIEPERTNDFVRTLVEKSKQYGELPMWELAANDTRCMIGYHAVSVIADAWAKGIQDYNLEETYAEMKKTAMLDKRGMKAYRNLGYVPSNKSSQGVSKTLEYAYDDWCVAQIAKALGKQGDYEYFMRRAAYYVHSFDASTGFMRGKTDRHEWFSPFDPVNVAYNYNYTEGNAFQYSLFVPHDLKGLSDLVGGKSDLADWLDRLFSTKMEKDLGEDTDVTGLIGQYAHGNEPSHHMAYLYNYAGKPWKTQQIVKDIMENLYDDTPDGICGNEDCGQMSAWYVMSAMGFYSVCPGEDYYELGAPIFDKVTLHLENDFVISTSNSNATYIQSARLNGKKYDQPLLKHEDILKGGTFELALGDHPNKNILNDYPEKSKDVEVVQMPYLVNSSDYFLDHYRVELKCGDDKTEIYYTLDGTTPGIQSKRYESPFEITHDATLKMIALKGKGKSNVAVRELKKSKPALLEGIALKSGLSYKYYEGIYRSVYDYAWDEPTDEGSIDIPCLNKILRDEWIGVDFYGYISIPEDGEYTFWTTANDGCQLLIDGDEQFESDGRKSKAFEQQTTLMMKKGLHKFQLKYFQCSDNIKLQVEWKQPGKKRQKIGEEYFLSER